jgi:glycosyltransferase involved in cell wall biosynthesis
MHHSTTKRECVSAIVPARNEEGVIAACVRSLAVQVEIVEVLVVNDQSADRTAEIVRGLTRELPKVRLLDAAELPPGWVGKNNAVWVGAKEARGEWLLLADADAVHEMDSAAKALEIAEQQNAAMVSFSPEQVMDTWYEKALLPYIYTRLGNRYRFDEINDPDSPAAAANGQFLLIRRDAYEAVGGHASVAREVLEDVALAARVKGARQRIWFGSGKGIVRVRMYRSFAAMWEGWKKNLYPLMGGSFISVVRETAVVLCDFLALLVAAFGLVSADGIERGGATGLLLYMGIIWGRGYYKNGFPVSLLAYQFPGQFIFMAVLWASYRSYRDGRVEWKGRAYRANPRRI